MLFLGSGFDRLDVGRLFVAPGETIATALHGCEELLQVDLERVEDLVGVVLGTEADLALPGAGVLDDLVHNAKPVPLTDQVRVDKEEIYDILDQMRATIPEEIKQARWIVKERQEMLAEAKREAERIIKEARDEQTRLISNEEVVKQAERQADEIIEEARAREREIRLGAEDYADDILNTLEVNLTKFTAAVQRGRDRLAGREEAEVR